MKCMNIAFCWAGPLASPHFWSFLQRNSSLMKYLLYIMFRVPFKRAASNSTSAICISNTTSLHYAVINYDCVYVYVYVNVIAYVFFYYVFALLLFVRYFIYHKIQTLNDYVYVAELEL